MLRNLLTRRRVTTSRASAPFAKARAKAQATIVIDAPLARIWSLVTDVNNWPQWNKSIQRAHLAGLVRPGVVFKWKSGGIGITSTFREIQPMTRLSWSGVAFGTKAVHGWTFKSTDHGVEVTTFETFDGWLPALMPGTMQKTLDETLPALLASLKAAAENNVSLPRA